jgi:site-specific DNA recombinase
MLRNPVYVGKIRWRDVTYEGHHIPVVSEILFEKAQEVLMARNEEAKGRKFHNRNVRLLTGIIKCGICGSPMFGGGGFKNGVRVPYYVCSKRFNDHDCNQSYVRAELLETANIEDVKNMFRDEQFMARLWEEANKRLTAEKPDLEKEIARVDSHIAKTRGPSTDTSRPSRRGRLRRNCATRKCGTSELGWRNWKGRSSDWKPGESGWSYRPSTGRCSPPL